MLTADLVRARRSKGKLTLPKWRGDARPRAVELAEGYVAIAADSVGATRKQFFEELATVEVGARDRRLADGLKKLVLDRCEVAMDASLDPAELRQRVFTAAAAERRALPDGEHLDRDELLTRVAEEAEVAPAELERLLYADLKQAARLIAFDAITGAALVDVYDLSQEQAVLLRAEKVVVEVTSKSPGVYRHLFRKLKFHRLLHTIESLAEGGYRIVIDGPLSLFSSVTKYGLQLALVLPALRACDRYHLTAVVRWGKTRDRLDFELEGGTRGKGSRAKGKATKGKTTKGKKTAKGKSAPAPETVLLPDEVARFLDKWQQRKKARWTAAASEAVFSLPGLGEVIPDLVFTRSKDGVEVYLEVLGYWSRDAAWKRVELAIAGLPKPILFCLPSKLRVSEEVLPDDLPAALYTYKSVLGIKAVEERLEALAAR